LCFTEIGGKMSLNKCLFTGNLTRDPEIREVNAGKSTKVASFSIAVNNKIKKQNGETVEQTEYVNLEAWDTAATVIEKILKKGDKVYVEGALRTESWEKDGQKHYRSKIRVTNFEKLSWKNDVQTETKADAEPELAGAGVGGDKPNDEIPF
jgi:single-strand DNA-binding protein